MPKNQNKPKTKKYRRDRNHAESLDNIGFSGIIVKIPIILVYDPPAKAVVLLLISILQSGKQTFAALINISVCRFEIARVPRVGYIARP